jgi:hypothetical protein
MKQKVTMKAFFAIPRTTRALWPAEFSRRNQRPSIAAFAECAASRDSYSADP